MTKRLKSKEGKVEEVLLANVLVDTSYQRDVQRHVSFIADNFDPAAAGTGTVGRRGDGKLYWIDGLQRATAMQRLGLLKWRCTVLESPGAKYEAHIFRLLNSRQSRRALNQTQLFKAALVEEDPTALAVQRATTAAGFVVRREGTTKGWPILSCPGLLLTACDRYGEATITDALKLVAETWPQVDDACHQTIIGSVLMIMYNYGDQLDRQHWKATVGELIPKAIIMNVIGAWSGNSYGKFADHMIRKYNKGRQGKKRIKLFEEVKSAEAS